ncbi:hypothetical protein ACSVDE_13370 [Pseudalkalibacillus sp. Hm43]|uniref:hypothetical protein n=1 Tax=Pseudalkalibacillus sp. Hm43 TaxID=3450742 RepID=UPI003F43EA05
MMRTALCTITIGILLFSCMTDELHGKGIKVEQLPTIFDDGTYIPEQITWKTWEDTSEIIPRGSSFEVVDYETGLYFQVQRRAGSRHADVQPLTKVDTSIMKAIYDGKWSWKRRAIFIRKGTHLIPASMHGMPHGAGALANNFPGHFCIHLPKSTTHRSSKEDPSHQLMIMKASDRLDDYIEHASSEQMANVFMLAVNQEDDSIIQKTIESSAHNALLENLFFIFPDRPFSKVDHKDFHLAEFPVEITVSTGKGLEKRKAMLTVERTSLTGRWYVNLESLFQED